jgi:hypothetical protein
LVFEKTRGLSPSFFIAGFSPFNHGTHGTHGTHGNGSPSAFRSVKWVCDPFLDERDRIVTYAHGLGGPCYGWKKTGDAPRAALCFALGYLIMPLWGGEMRKPGDSPSPSSCYGVYLDDFVEPVANGEGINQAPVGRCVWALIGSGTPLPSRGDCPRFLVISRR